jgi:hypothetical protein
VGLTPTLLVLDATISDDATPMFSLDFVNPHLERLLTSLEWPKTIYPSDPPPSSVEVKQRARQTWRKAKVFLNLRHLRILLALSDFGRNKAVTQHNIFDYKVKEERLMRHDLVRFLPILKLRSEKLGEMFSAQFFGLGL